MAQLFANNAGSKTVGIVEVGHTAIGLTSGDGALFPTPTGGDYFLVTLVGISQAKETSWEVVKCTARSGDILTVVRAQLGTTEVEWPSATIIELRATAQEISHFEEAYNWGDHGLGGYASASTTYTISEVDGLLAAVPSDWSTLSNKPTTLAGYGIETAVDDKITELVDSAPGTMDTLNELAAALGDDANFAATMTNALAAKVDDSQVLTNVPANAVFTDTVYALPFANNSANWNTAYQLATTAHGWGDHASAGYLTSMTGPISSGDATFWCTAGIEGHNNNSWPLEIQQPTANKDAMMSFHVSGDYAVNFGIDGSTNKLSVGGWSMPGVLYEIYHSGNKGDANTVGGASPNVSASNNTIVKRSGNGYVYANYFNMSSGPTTGAPTDVMVQTGNDNFCRWQSPGTFKTNLGLIDNSATQPHSFTIRNTSPTLNFRDTDHRGFHLHCNSNLLYMLNSNAVDGTTWTQTNGHWAFYIDSMNNNANFGGAITAIGNITAYSDGRIKDNIETIDNALEKVTQMRGIYYNRNDLDEKENAVRRTGVVAQEVEKVLPEVVRENEEKDVDNRGKTLQGGRKRLTVDYGNMVGVLIEAIKEQQIQIDELQGQLCAPWWKKLLGGK